MASLQRFMGVGKHPAYDSALAHYEAGRYSEAIPLFETALRECQDSLVQKLARNYLAESYARVGYRRLNQGEWERAYAYFTMATDFVPEFADWWFQAGFAAYKQGDYGAAAKALEAALRINPKFVRAQLLRGLVQYASGQREEGLDAIQQWAEQASLFSEHLQEALQLHREQRYSEAQQVLESWIRALEDNYAEYIQQGDEAYRRGDLQTAEACFRHVLNARPHYADVRNRLGVVLTAQGRLEEAVEQFLAALRINPRYVEAHINLAIAYHELGNYEQAREVYQQVLAIDPENRIAREALQRMAA
ncbi:MAG: tetratricopeptide repeat protein [Fimbriimonadales bacterium]|nr:tetratricopeptide repeat protein [Fimbriimonadales bacterium]MDW8051389.1 tetratricopeptide repeat protein [Armatimonadota bacterium]